MSRKTAQKTTTTTSEFHITLHDPTGSGSLDAAGAIKYPSAKKITAALAKAGLPASEIAKLAKLGGTAIHSGTTPAANGAYSSASAAVLIDAALAQLPISYAANNTVVSAWFDAIFGRPPTGNNPIGISYQNYLSAPTAVMGEIAKGATAASLSDGVVSNVPSSVNLGAGYTAAQLRDRQLTTEMINGQMMVANINATGQARASVYGSVDQLLQNYDLNALAPQLSDWVFKQNITDPKELMSLIRGTDLYKQQFAGLIEQQKTAAANGVKPLTEATYMSLVNSYQQTAQAAGLPMSMLTAPGTKGKTVMQDLVAGNVSAAEFSRRVASGYQAVNGLPQAVQDAFMQQHGITKGQLAAYFLDPKSGEEAINRERQALGANLGYNAQSAGLQGFTGQQAMDLGEMVRASALGATAQDPYNSLTLGQAQKALQTASKDVSLTGSAPGGNAPTVDTQTLIGAQVAGFEGTNLQAAQTTAQKAAQAAAAPFEKGGGYAETSKGVTGIGSGAI